MRIQSSDKLTVSNGCLKVNGRPFVVDYPDEPLYGIDENGKLETLFRGHLRNTWNREDIQGYWA